jgi:hypothetical protein
VFSFGQAHPQTTTGPAIHIRSSVTLKRLKPEQGKILRIATSCPARQKITS